MPRFDILGQGFVCRRDPKGPAPVAAGPRVVVAAGGELVCSYVVQQKLGLNDFLPVVARSGDGGATWTEQGPIWPGLADRWSIFGSISRTPRGEIIFFGTRCPIDRPGESNWSEATKGLKANELIWAKSLNQGQEFTNPAVIPMPIAGSAEAAGAMCITRGGRWVCCYAPYHTFDPQVQVDRQQVVALYSGDEGRTWGHSTMLRFEAAESGGAEAWVVELADSRLLGTAWNVNLASGEGKAAYPNAYALSGDGGVSWSPTRSTGILGDTTALLALPDGGPGAAGGRALFLNVRRKPPEAVGLWMALVQPGERDFGVRHDQKIWSAPAATQSGQAADHDAWVDFNFGEPAATLLPDGTVLVVFWYIQSEHSGIRWIRLRMVE